MRRTRRRLLGTLGGAVGSLALAGCSAVGSGPDDDTSAGGRPTVTPVEPPSDSNGGVTVQRVRVLPELVSVGLTDPDTYAIYGDQESQYVVATVSVTTPADDPEFAFAVDQMANTVSDVRADRFDDQDFLAGVGRAYEHGERDTGWVAARLPKPLEADTVELTWNGGRHRVDDDVVEALGREPTTFEPTLSAPDRASVGDTVTATVNVENTGNADGTFVGALNRREPYNTYDAESAVVLPVPAGDTATWTHEYRIDRTNTPNEETTMTFYLRWRVRRSGHDVIVEP